MELDREQLKNHYNKLYPNSELLIEILLTLMEIKEILQFDSLQTELRK